MEDAVFAYGSLVAEHPDAPVAELRGWRRHWGVAMDNTVDVAGYKHYVEADTGVRPAVHVAFLDVERCARAAVTGVLVPVGPDRLAALDARERNYDRVDVTTATARRDGGQVPQRVWTYVGSPAGRSRLADARAAGTAVVVGDYLRAVKAAFRDDPRLGGAATYPAVTVDHGLPIAELHRVDDPGDSRPGAPGRAGGIRPSSAGPARLAHRTREQPRAPCDPSRRRGPTAG